MWYIAPVPAIETAPLRRILSDSGKTQAELGRMLGGITRQTVNQWVKGTEPIPRPRAAQIAAKLGAWPEEARDA